MTNLFRITNNNGEERKEIITVTPDHTYYTVYNKYLQMDYCTTIEENEDFIPFVNENEIIMVLIGNEEEIIDVEEAFDCMMDYFYQIV